MDLRDIDESKLSRVDRLGLAYCRLNRWEWDDILGEKPASFDALPDFEPPPQESKFMYVIPAAHAIKDIIGKANASRYHWKFDLDSTDSDWFHWYINQSDMDGKREAWDAQYRNQQEPDLEKERLNKRGKRNSGRNAVSNPFDAVGSFLFGLLLGFLFVGIVSALLFL